MKKTIIWSSAVLATLVPTTMVISCAHGASVTKTSNDFINRAKHEITTLKKMLKANNSYIFRGSSFAAYIYLKDEIITKINSIEGISYTIKVERNNKLTNGARDLSDMKNSANDDLTSPTIVAGSDATQISNLKLQADDVLTIQFGNEVFSKAEAATVGKIKIPVVASKIKTFETYMKTSVPALYHHLQTMKINNKPLFKSIYWKQKIAQIALDISDIKYRSSLSVSASNAQLRIDRIFKDLYAVFEDGRGAEFVQFMQNFMTSFTTVEQFIDVIKEMLLSSLSAKNMVGLEETLQEIDFDKVKNGLVKIFATIDWKVMLRAFSIKGHVKNNIVSKVLWFIPPLFNINIDLPKILMTVVKKVPTTLEKLYPSATRQKWLDEATFVKNETIGDDGLDLVVKQLTQALYDQTISSQKRDALRMTITKFINMNKNTLKIQISAITNVPFHISKLLDQLNVLTPLQLLQIITDAKQAQVLSNVQQNNFILKLKVTLARNAIKIRIYQKVLTDLQIHIAALQTEISILSKIKNVDLATLIQNSLDLFKSIDVDDETKDQFQVKLFEYAVKHQMKLANGTLLTNKQIKNFSYIQILNIIKSNKATLQPQTKNDFLQLVKTSFENVLDNLSAEAKKLALQPKGKIAHTTHLNQGAGQYVDSLIGIIFHDLLKVHNYRYANPKGTPDLYNEKDANGQVIVRNQGDNRPWKYTTEEAKMAKANNFPDHFRFYIKNNHASSITFSKGMVEFLDGIGSAKLFAIFFQYTISVPGSQLDIVPIIDNMIKKTLKNLFESVYKTPTGETAAFDNDDLSDSYKFSSKLIYNLFYHQKLIIFGDAAPLAEFLKALVEPDTIAGKKTLDNIPAFLKAFITIRDLLPNLDLLIAKTLVDKDGNVIPFSKYISKLIDGLF